MKILFISRQSNSTPLDFQLLIKEFTHKIPSVQVADVKTAGDQTTGAQNADVQDTDVEVKVIAKKYSGILGLAKGFVNTIVQVFEIKKSDIVFLDGYCPAVSLFKHNRKTTTVVQLWHSVSGFKKAGFAALDTKEGRSGFVAKLLKMHKNYDYILSPSKASVPIMQQVFGSNYKSDQFIISPVPRVDYLCSDQFLENTRNKILKKYQQLNNDKLNIVYVPTYRNDIELFEKNVLKLIENIDQTKYNIVIKQHPLSKLSIGSVLTLEQFSSMECLTIADFVISDYSAIAFEAMLLKIPTFFYLYDYEQYLEGRGLFIDPKIELPEFVFTDMNEFKSISDGWDNCSKEQAFIDKYVEIPQQGCTKAIVGKLI
jgi:CDP-ribitol ribitolphosphotransferase